MVGVHLVSEMPDVSKSTTVKNSIFLHNPLTLIILPRLLCSSVECKRDIKHGGKYFQVQLTIKMLLKRITLCCPFPLAGTYCSDSPVQLFVPSEINRLFLHQILCNKLCPVTNLICQYDPPERPAIEMIVKRFGS